MLASRLVALEIFDKIVSNGMLGPPLQDLFSLAAANINNKGWLQSVAPGPSMHRSYSRTIEQQQLHFQRAPVCFDSNHTRGMTE